MQPTLVFLAQQGWNAAGLARTSALNQLAFDYNRAINTSKEKEEKTAADRAREDRFRVAAGAEPRTNAKPLDTEELMSAHAAAYVLALRHINKPNPETGRPLAHMERYLVALPNAVVANVERLTQRNIDAVKADAMMLKDKTTGELPDISARIAAIKSENAILAAKQEEAVADEYIKLVTMYSEESDDEDLVNIVLDAITNAGRDPAVEITRAADAMVDAARKRLAAGLFARIEPDIYALTTVGQRGGKSLNEKLATA